MKNRTGIQSRKLRVKKKQLKYKIMRVPSSDMTVERKEGDRVLLKHQFQSEGGEQDVQEIIQNDSGSLVINWRD